MEEGSDGLGNKAWLYSSGKTRRKLKGEVKRVWKDEGFPEEWREGFSGNTNS